MKWKMLHNNWISGMTGHVAEHNEITTRLLNVREFGAVGDNIHDDAIAIQNALDELRARSGGQLYIPAGKYRVGSPLHITVEHPIYNSLSNSISICGDGGASELLYLPTDGSDCLHILGHTGGVSTLHIHDLAFIGMGYGANTGHAIRLHRCIMPHHINNVVIREFGGGAGIHLETAWLGNYKSCWLSGNKHGIQLTDDLIPGPYGSPVNIVIEGCHIQGNNSHGICGGANHLTIDTCIIEGNHSGGVVLTKSRHVSLRNNYFETNGDGEYADIHLVNTSYFTIEECGTYGSVASFFSDSASNWGLLVHNELGGTIIYDGQEIWVYVNDALTTFNFSGSSLRGNKSIDYRAFIGDVVHAININDIWYCTIIEA